MMEFKSDSTWGLSVSYTDLAAAVTSSGGFSEGQENEGCVETMTWPGDQQERKDTISVCDGVFTLEHDWIAVFKKAQ